MHVVAVQNNIQWESKDANYARVRRLLAQRQGPGADLIVLPEMFATGFSMNAVAIAESADGPTRRFLGELAREQNAHVLGGLVTEGEGGKGRNEALVIDPSGSELARYSKRHPFSFSGEHNCYEAGDGLPIAEIGAWRLCPLVCYDLRFPEDFREAVTRGANLFAVIANWPAAREAHWRALLVARAIENQAYVIGVNRCGADPKLTYSGCSLIVNPQGEIVADAGQEEGIIEATLDLSALTEYRTRFPALADMRHGSLGGAGSP